MYVYELLIDMMLKYNDVQISEAIQHKQYIYFLYLK